MKKTILFIVLAALCLFFRAAGQIINKPRGQIITGKVTNEQGIPLPGATVKLKGSSIAVNTVADGTYTIGPVSANDILVISFVGYQPIEIRLSELQKQQFITRLKNNTGVLDEVQIIAYGTTTIRLSTSGVTSVKATDIEKQPVSNPLDALEGRVPVLFVSHSCRVSGAGFIVQIRGRGARGRGGGPGY